MQPENVPYATGIKNHFDRRKAKRCISSSQMVLRCILLLAKLAQSNATDKNNS